MLHTTETAAVESLTAFATSMDYLCDDDGTLLVEYNVRLSDVADFIAANERHVEGLYAPLAGA